MSDDTMTVTRGDLFRVYLFGMKGGVATALANYAPSASEDLRAECAERVMESINGDPLVADALAERAVQVASGLDPEACEMRAYGAPDAEGER